MDNLIAKLRTIPHLTLPITFPLSDMVGELNAIDEFVPYESITPAAKEKLRKHFLGRSLLGADGDSKQLSELDFKTKVQPTELAVKMPVTMDAIRSIGADQFRASIMLIPAGGSLYWHQHHRQPPHIMTVQIPLVVPPDFWYEVTTKENLGGPHLGPLEYQEPINNALVYRANYPAGKPTIFNSYHWHNVFNRGEAGRITTLLYCDLHFEPFNRLVKEAVEIYYGPVIE